MNYNKVDEVVDNGLCISCGICKANCPRNCIDIKRIKYSVYPVIDSDKCVNCGMCAKACPVRGIDEYDKSNIEDYLLGEYREIICAAVKDEKLLEEVQSGGAVTGIVQKLLRTGRYDGAFLVDGSRLEELETELFAENDSLIRAAGSKYVTVNHYNTVRYMADNPEKKLIIVAQGCVIDGILNTIELKKLNRDNYLFIGLFCDKTMNYGVVDYFKKHPVSKGRTLVDIGYRSKKQNGWPGNVRLAYSDNSHEDLLSSARQEVKDFFMPERCLYCMNKLNLKCDIAVGDNYIPDNKNNKGVSSILIRTQKGSEIWDECKDDFEWHADDAAKFRKSQALANKKSNYSNAVFKGLYNDKPDEGARRQYNKHISRINKMQACTGNIYSLVRRELIMDKIKHRILTILRLNK